jgi:hypothetical protein
MWFAHKDDHLSFADHPHFDRFCDYFGISRTGGTGSHGDKAIIVDYPVRGSDAHGLPGSFAPFIDYYRGCDVEVQLGLPINS